MTICKETGLACDCQPDEGVECSALNGGLKRMMLGWRAAAIKAQAELRALAASPQPPSPDAQDIEQAVAEHMAKVDTYASAFATFDIFAGRSAVEASARRLAQQGAAMSQPTEKD